MMQTVAEQEKCVVGYGVVDCFLQPDESSLFAFSVQQGHIDLEETQERICLVFFPSDFAMSCPG